MCIHIIIIIHNYIHIRIQIKIDTHIYDTIIIVNIHIIASRIPAARPERSLFAVPGFLSFCVRKLDSPAEEEDDEENK